jgi:hypothetical protein
MVGEGEPVAVTVNVSVPPHDAVWLNGCVVITGATSVVVEVPTFSVAGALVTEPALFETTAV